ncbi:hypothetical protein M404DRAFT_34380 [Pisolithus tinctorius Marx 270]|uniref:Uncharacterized protein n=1 Tax=Pisolithus tinctorius Marx 270 TaxID=870435 RepID=A0A0C3NHJ6_PISTI|nr:hypothetical protein M404DRAFT_34380 [Pisolithus tinctorius Marx 270]
MLSNPNDSPPNVGVPADDLAHAASILQLLLGSSQGDTELRNVLLVCLGLLTGPLLTPTAPEPQAASSPVLLVNAPPTDIVQDKPAPATAAALVNHIPAEPSPATIVVQELDASPTLDLPTFDMLPDTPSSTSTSTSTVAPSHAAAPAAPTMPTHQTLNVSESGLECLPADSLLTGHMSLIALQTQTMSGSPVSNGESTILIGTLSSSNVLQRMVVSPSTCPSPATIVTLLELSALEPWGSNVCIVVNFIILAPYTTTRHSPELGSRRLCMGSTPPALTSPCYPAKPVVEITQRPARTSKHAHVKSPSPSPTPPPSTSSASSSNLAPTPSTSSSPPSLPPLSNAEMLVVLHEALRTTTEVLDQASKGHVTSEKALGKRKSCN